MGGRAEGGRVEGRGEKDGEEGISVGNYHIKSLQKEHHVILVKCLSTNLCCENITSNLVVLSTA